MSGLLGVLGGIGKFVGNALSSNAGVSGMFGLGSDLITNKGALRRQRLADAENERRWHMQNAYNTPKEQMLRLKDAGLNPNLIYGSGGTNVGNAGAIAPSKPAPYNIKNPVPLPAMMLEAQIQNIRDDSELKGSQKLLNDSKIPGAKAESNKQMQLLAQSILQTQKISETLKAEIGVAIEKLRQAKSSTKIMEARNNFRAKLYDANIDPDGTVGTKLFNTATGSTIDAMNWLSSPSLDEFINKQKLGFKTLQKAYQASRKKN
jgi:hypothetical protein